VRSIDVVELVQLGLGGQPQPVQEVDDLLVRAPFGELLDRIADVPEPAVRAVDVRDARFRGDDLAKALLGHRRLPRRAGRRVPATILAETEPIAPVGTRDVRLHLEHWRRAWRTG
jgi:hypothetical protein